MTYPSIQVKIFILVDFLYDCCSLALSILLAPVELVVIFDPGDVVFLVYRSSDLDSVSIPTCQDLPLEDLTSPRSIKCFGAPLSPFV